MRNNLLLMAISLKRRFTILRISSLDSSKRPLLAANEKLAAAKERAEALNQYLLTIQVKAGEEDRLFGSVGTQDIADALVSKGLEVERSEVRLPDGAIRVLGEYEVDIQLHSDVTATIQLHVVAE